MSEPKTLDELRAISDPGARARAVRGYVERAQQKIVEANALRREAIAAVIEREGGSRPSAVAKECDVSVSTVKAVRDNR